MKWILMQHSGLHAQGSVLPEGVMGSNGSEEFFPYFLLHKDPNASVHVVEILGQINNLGREEKWVRK